MDDFEADPSVFVDEFSKFDSIPKMNLGSSTNSTD